MGAASVAVWCGRTVRRGRSSRRPHDQLAWGRQVTFISWSRSRAVEALARAAGRTHWLYTRHVNAPHGCDGRPWKNRLHCVRVGPPTLLRWVGIRGAEPSWVTAGSRDSGRFIAKLRRALPVGWPPRKKGKKQGRSIGLSQWSNARGKGVDDKHTRLPVCEQQRWRGMLTGVCGDVFGEELEGRASLLGTGGQQSSDALAPAPAGRATPFGLLGDPSIPPRLHAGRLLQFLLDPPVDLFGIEGQPRTPAMARLSAAFAFALWLRQCGSGAAAGRLGGIGAVFPQASDPRLQFPDPSDRGPRLLRQPRDDFLLTEVDDILCIQPEVWYMSPCSVECEYSEF